MQIQTELCLRLENLWLDRLHQKVDCTGRITSADEALFSTLRGEKQYRHQAGSLLLFQNLRQLESVDLRQAHIQHHEGEVLRERVAKRSLARLGANHLVA